MFFDDDDDIHVLLEQYTVSFYCFELFWSRDCYDDHFVILIGHTFAQDRSACLDSVECYVSDVLKLFLGMHGKFNENN